MYTLHSLIKTGISQYFCRKHDPEMMKMTASGKLNPPDLWIHHDQMELKQMQQHQTLLSSSSNEFDLIDDHRTTHSLDKRALRASRRGKILFKLRLHKLTLTSNKSNLHICNI